MFGKIAVMLNIVLTMATAPAGTVVWNGTDGFNHNSPITITKLTNGYLIEEDLNKEALDYQDNGNYTSMRAECEGDAQAAFYWIRYYGM